MKLVLHSYTFRRYPLPHVYAVASRYGWEAIELVHFHFDPERVEEEVPAAVALGRRYGVEVHCVGYTGDWISDDPAHNERSLALAERTIETSAAAGVTLVNGWSGTVVRDPDDWRRNGTAIAEPAHYERAATGYQRLAGFARERGVTIGVEVYPSSVHDTVAATAALLELVAAPNVVATVDPGNSYVISEADRDPEVLEQLGDRLGYFHLKNLFAAGGVANFNVNAASGVLDNHAWITKVRDLGVPAMAVEYCGSGDPHPPIALARDYVRDCLALADDLAGRTRAAQQAAGVAAGGRS